MYLVEDDFIGVTDAPKPGEEAEYSDQGEANAVFGFRALRLLLYGLGLGFNLIPH